MNPISDLDVQVKALEIAAHYMQQWEGDCPHDSQDWEMCPAVNSDIVREEQGLMPNGCRADTEQAEKCWQEWFLEKARELLGHEGEQGQEAG